MNEFQRCINFRQPKGQFQRRQSRPRHRHYPGMACLAYLASSLEDLGSKFLTLGFRGPKASDVALRLEPEPQATQTPNPKQALSHPSKGNEGSLRSVPQKGSTNPIAIKLCQCFMGMPAPRTESKQNHGLQWQAHPWRPHQRTSAVMRLHV